MIITDSSLVHPDSHVKIREDLKFSFNQGYRDITSSIGKMEDLTHDIELGKTQKITSLPIMKVDA